MNLIAASSRRRIHMKAFVFDGNHIYAASRGAITDGQISFTTEQELASICSEMPISRLVEVWNQLPGVTAVRKFTDRKTAVARIWKAVQTLEPAVAPQAAQERLRKRSSGGEATCEPAANKANKTATVLELLRRTGGATLEDIMAATGWQAHSVRGFISGVLGKRMGLTVESAKREDGKRTYSLAS
jgi:uncharacterized protein DUF3489